MIGWTNDTSGSGDGDNDDDIPIGISFGASGVEYCNVIDRTTLIDTHGWTITDGGLNLNCPPVVLKATVFLQGAMLSSDQEGLMSDYLRSGNDIPATSPYADSFAADITLLDITGEEAIVDWVYVELRDKDDFSNVIASQSAFVQRNGIVIDPLTGDDYLSFSSVAPDQYHISISHRNHVPVISKNTLSLSRDTASPASADFSVQSFNYGHVVEQRSLFSMLAGDADGNTQVQVADELQVINDFGNTVNYSLIDTDLNGQIQTSDVFYNNNNLGLFLGRQNNNPVTPPSIQLSFKNVINTIINDQTFFEADVYINASEEFKLGQGMVYLNYNTQAFGELIHLNQNISFSTPQNAILANNNIQYSFVQNDNQNDRWAITFRHNQGSLNTDVNNVATTPKLLFHIKIKYLDPTEQPQVAFEQNRVFTKQFFTACGGQTIDCYNFPGVNITNDSFDNNYAIENQTLDNLKVALVPNPATNTFRIQGLKNKATILIYDISGKMIMSHDNYNNQNIQIAGLKNATYIIKIIQKDQTIIKKLIKI